jgi:hypothetical protein
MRTTTLLILAASTVLHACSVPVFRYALERWQADPLPVAVIYRDSLTAEQRGLVAAIEQAPNSPTYANLSCIPINLSDSLAELPRLLADSLPSGDLPRVAIYYDQFRFGHKPFWDGPLNLESVRRIADSPLRREIGRRICSGESSVWVLVASGNRAKDRKAADTLGATLRAMATTLTLPEIDPEDQRFVSRGTGSAPVRLAFSMVVLSRGDPTEEVFLRALFGSAPEIRDVTDPVAFPMFGRGRALFGLKGEQITASQVERACRFLVGMCSCTIKEANPGIDMPMAVDWNAGLRDAPAGDEPEPPLASLSSAAAASDSSAKKAPRKTVVRAPDTSFTGNRTATAVACSLIARAGADSTALRSASRPPDSVFRPWEEAAGAVDRRPPWWRGMGGGIAALAGLIVLAAVAGTTVVARRRRGEA